MQTLRETPISSFGSVAWETVRDFEKHELRSLPSNEKVADLSTPSGNLLILDGTAADCRVSLAIRPSGTEPKIKFYGFVHTDALPDLATAKRRATECARSLMKEMQDWVEAR
jgi:phosphoglucomutase/phosphomannomutase